MRFKIFTLLFFTCFGSSLIAQDLNAYKYVIIPRKFDFQNSNDKYQLNSLSKFLFNKKGMVVLMDDEKTPQDIYDNPCLALRADVLESSNLFTTKLTINLTDCRNTVVLTTEEGRSKLKDFKKGHQEALRKAFLSIQALDYSFDKSLAINRNDEEKNTAAEMEPEMSKEPPVVQEVVVETSTPVPVVKPNERSVENPSLDVVTSQENDVVKAEKSSDIDNINVLYAQKIANGYQLVDNTPKIVFMALKSASEGLYYLKNEAGILYKVGNSWFAEYYKDGILVKEAINIKF